MQCTRRSILKPSSSPPHTRSPAYQSAQHAVHFPPSPVLTRTFPVHSAHHYDRTPIVVGPNSCALPERGCPGRTYNLDDSQCTLQSGSSSHGMPRNGRSMHPRASAYNNSLGLSMGHDDFQRNAATMRPSYPPPPPLIPDTSSSSSDESDGFISTPIQLQMNAPYPNYHGLSPPTSQLHVKYAQYTPEDSCTGTTPTALSFLPHPASPRNSMSNTYLTHDEASPPKPRPRARRHRERDLTPPRRDAEHEDEDEEDTRLATDKHNRKRSPSRGIVHKAYSIPKSYSSFSTDEGCLGGF